MGGNAVLGFQYALDLEGETGIIARSYGTAVTIAKASDYIRPRGSPIHQQGSGGSGDVHSPEPLEIKAPIRRTASDRKKDVQLLTLVEFPPNVQVILGGLVAARAIKLLDEKEAAKEGNNAQLRDEWWAELRSEIKSHARALHCSCIIGYREHVTIIEDVCVLTAYGTAARCGWLRRVPSINLDSPVPSSPLSLEPPGYSFYWLFSNLITDIHGIVCSVINRSARLRMRSRSMAHGPIDDDAADASPMDKPLISALKNYKKQHPSCALFHLPYSRRSAPFKNLTLVPCAVCNKRLGLHFHGQLTV
jgi:uncharacterized protein YbjQ (UPF0145 family)